MDFNLQTQVGQCLRHRVKAQINPAHLLSLYPQLPKLSVSPSVCLPVHPSTRCPGSGCDSDSPKTGQGKGLPVALWKCCGRKQTPQKRVHPSERGPQGRAPSEGPVPVVPASLARADPGQMMMGLVAPCQHLSIQPGQLLTAPG